LCHSIVSFSVYIFSACIIISVYLLAELCRRLRLEFGCLFQVLIATSTLAWGVNFPAHLVVIKGTEYYDGKTKHYVDFPITGQFDNSVDEVL